MLQCMVLIVLVVVGVADCSEETNTRFANVWLGLSGFSSLFVLISAFWISYWNSVDGCDDDGQGKMFKR